MAALHSLRPWGYARRANEKEKSEEIRTSESYSSSSDSSNSSKFNSSSSSSSSSSDGGCRFFPIFFLEQLVFVFVLFFSSFLFFSRVSAGDDDDDDDDEQRTTTRPHGAGRISLASGLLFKKKRTHTSTKDNTTTSLKHIRSHDDNVNGESSSDRSRRAKFIPATASREPSRRESPSTVQFERRFVFVDWKGKRRRGSYDNPSEESVVNSSGISFRNEVLRWHRE